MQECGSCENDMSRKQVLSVFLPQVKEGIAKIVEGVNFGTRGVRLLVSDVGSAGRLFWRAATGMVMPCQALTNG